MLNNANASINYDVEWYTKVRLLGGKQKVKAAPKRGKIKVTRNMNLLERLAKIRQVLAYLPDNDFKALTVIQLNHLVYILQVAGEDFDQDFEFRYYKMVSVSMATDIDRGTDWDWLDITFVDDHNTALIKLLKPEEDKDTVYNGKALSKRSKELIKKLGDQPAKVLDLLSSVVYLSQNYYSGKELMRKAIELKGKSKYWKTAWKLWNWMIKDEYIIPKETAKKRC